MHEVKELKLSDLFDFNISSNKSWFTKSFINKNKGDIPVYGATKLPDEVSYGYVANNLPNVKYFNDCLTYNIDGTAGYVFYRKGTFSLSEKVKPLILKKEFENKIDLIYLKYILEPLFRSKVKGRKGIKGKNEYSKLNSSMIKDLKIKIPINQYGELDLKYQNEIASKYEYITKLKDTLKERKNILNNIKVDITEKTYYKNLALKDVFSAKNGNSIYTKSYCKNNPGNYEVFTGTTIGNFGFIDTYDYDYEQLTFTTDGENAGTLQILSGKYNIGGHRTILIPKIENINLNYFKFMLEDVLSKKYKRSDVPSVRWSNIKNETISIPINEDGTIDIEFQEKISKKYKTINDIKSKAINEIDTLLKKEILVT